MWSLYSWFGTVVLFFVVAWLYIFIDPPFIRFLQVFLTYLQSQVMLVSIRDSHFQFLRNFNSWMVAAKEFGGVKDELDIVFRPSETLTSQTIRDSHFQFLRLLQCISCIRPTSFVIPLFTDNTRMMMGCFFSPSQETNEDNGANED